MERIVFTNVEFKIALNVIGSMAIIAQIVLPDITWILIIALNVELTVLPVNHPDVSPAITVTMEIIVKGSALHIVQPVKTRMIIAYPVNSDIICIIIIAVNVELTVCDTNGCQSCQNGYFGYTCKTRCAVHCTYCRKSDGYCNSCESGYYLKNNRCYKCRTHCFSCESTGCQSCQNGYYGHNCQRSCAANCLSCRNSDGYCNFCKFGYYLKNSRCFNCETPCAFCESSRCQACFDGYWGSICEHHCGHHCSSCNQSNGVCISCEDGYWGSQCTTCGSQCKACNQSNGCLECSVGYYGHTCDKYNCNGCTECQYGNGSLCHAAFETEAGQQTSTTSLAGGVGGEEYVNEDTDYFHSITIIENTNYHSPPAKSSHKDNTLILTEDNLEIDADDVSAQDITDMSETNECVYYNNTREVSKFKLTVANLPEYVHNICIKDIEEEFQKIPYGLLKPYEVSQTKLNMHRNRYKGIYPYDDTRVVVRGGDTDYINASYIDGFRKRKAYIAALGPMAKQLGDFGQFWRMVWQQKVERIAIVTNLVECEKTKCEQYWPDHGQCKLYGDIKVMCKVEKVYADLIWRQFTLSKGTPNSEEKNLHQLQFTAWPDKDIPDNVTSIIEFRHKVNALPSTFDGPVLVHC
ncbi:PTPRF-like protein, partial [Mya arenaria]